MEEKLDLSDGKIAHYSELLVTGFGLTAFNPLENEQYQLQCYEPSAIEKDKRKTIIRIHHTCFFPPKTKGEFLHNRLDFVLDLENHQKNMPFHLNYSGESKTCACKKCKSYFDQFNHFPLKSANCETDTDKIIDFDLTIADFIQKLGAAGFFKEFCQVYQYKIN